MAAVLFGLTPKDKNILARIISIIIINSMLTFIQYSH